MTTIGAGDLQMEIGQLLVQEGEEEDVFEDREGRGKTGLKNFDSKIRDLFDMI